MTELPRLLAAYDRHRAAGRTCALVTEVDVLGSAYRWSGARMLVTEDGELTGTIGGGCLEDDARRRARQAIQQGRSTPLTYDMTDEEDPHHGTGPGCQRVMRNLLELLCSYAWRLKRAVRATAVHHPHAQTRPGAALGGGQRRLTVAGECRGRHDLEPALQAAPALAATVALAGEQSSHLDLATATEVVRVLLEVLRPPFRLTEDGAGNDAQPLVRLAPGLGWYVTVLDGQPAPYLGLLGPRTLATRLLANAAAELGQSPEVGRLLAGNRRYAPVGLPIGGETPVEIALAIAAEIQAARPESRPGACVTCPVRFTRRRCPPATTSSSKPLLKIRGYRWPPMGGR